MKGTVVKIATKEGRNRRGPWTLYSFITKADDGQESGWVSFGFEAPPFREGEYIEYDVEQNADGYNSYKKGTGKIIPKPAAPAASAARAEPTGTPTASGSGSTGSGSTGSSGSYDDRQRQIVLQHSQEMAIQTVAVLLQNDSLPTTGAKTKAGEAKRFEEIVASVDKLTVKFYNDVVSGRLLSNVPDMGIISTAPDAPLPGAEPSTTSKSSEY